MDFEETILIAATPEQVYERAADLERYSDLANQYRESRILSKGDGSAVVERHARIAGLPLKWRSDARFFPPERVEFVQTSGPLRGMRTVWTIAADSDQTRLTIVHRLAPAPGPLGDWVARAVYRLFVRKLALEIMGNVKASVQAQAG